MVTGLHSARERNIRKRRERLAQGICVHCGKNKISPNSVSSCDSCLKRNSYICNKWYKNKKNLTKHNIRKIQSKKNKEVAGQDVIVATM
jgi:hypothetical protein